MDHPLNVLSLCSGGGGLDIGFELALPAARVVCWVEWEAFACEWLAARMAAKCLAQAPVWTDLRTFDGKPWRGVVDCLTAGYPCQPFSIAGRRLGSDDPRHLWPEVHRVIGEVEPALVFLENVGNHLRQGFEQVANELCDLGYRVAAGLFTAEEVGASHRRERLFILGLAERDGRRLDESRRGPQERAALGRAVPPVADANELQCRDSATAERDGSAILAAPTSKIVEHTDKRGRGKDARRPEIARPLRNVRDEKLRSTSTESGPMLEQSESERWREGRPEHAGEQGRSTVAESSPSLEDAARDERPGRERQARRAGRRRVCEASHEAADGYSPRLEIGDGEWRDDGQKRSPFERDGLPLFPPGPDRFAEWQRILELDSGLAPAQSKLRLVADGLADSYAGRLRLLGNGVVPLQAGYAFCSLWAALGSAGATAA